MADPFSWKNNNPVQDAIDEAMGYYLVALANELARRLLEFGDETAVTASYERVKGEITVLEAILSLLQNSYDAKQIRIGVILTEINNLAINI